GKRWTNSAAPASSVARQPSSASSKPSSSSTQTNAGPHFTVRAYEIRGDTLLSTNTLMSVLVPYTGTNVSIGDIIKAASELQMEYRDRGYPTVSVTIPQQQITNGIVRIRVFQGRLSEVLVTGNHYFSSNNIMRALPSLHTNMILTSPIFQAELDRANANQDRQIYPELEPGSEPNTTALQLRVKDRFPLHAKLELNNQSTPGTPELRLNGSAAYNNLWQLEHSMGLQYGFSPEAFKTGDQWNFYDQPLVANYSGFYRLPLGGVPSLAETVANGPGNFGYNEATRRFVLPAPSGRPELNIFASRSTIDTGLDTLSDRVIQDIPGVLSIREQDVQEDLTVTEDLGWRTTLPLGATPNFQSGISGGMDYKTYGLTSYKTNNFFFSITTVNPDGSTNAPVSSTVASGVPTTHRPLDYLPLSVRYDASLRDRLGATTFGLGLGGNVWFSGSLDNLREIAGSQKSSGYWVTLSPSVTRDLSLFTNWDMTIRADGQWASEPLISNERYGAGGVNSVRGYREGEVFGDTGWHIGFEQKTPPQVIGLAYGKTPLVLRGAAYMDYAEAYLLDPRGRGRVSLWGAGVGGVLSLGAHWEARFLFSVPLLNAGTTDAYQPRFNFSLIGQF
ncbi:MAG TPA: POTRA domain-containing protein, partial [Verrucomicrobiae bacterium]|nr:POTRA domain-containing protein [Verrucomicrobiae bacterium]